VNERVALKGLNLEHFGVSCVPDKTRLLIHMRGNADGEILSALASFVEEIDGEARRLGVGEAVIDIHDLYFMSSSCISLFLRWIDGLTKSSPKGRYTIRFVSNPNLRWQKRTLQVLSTMGQAVVTID
jgi:hypothetical protein